MEEMNPCPKCKSTEVSVDLSFNDCTEEERFWGECEDCGYCGPECGTYLTAIIFWNKEKADGISDPRIV
jgi:hypothetical protein